MTTCTYYLADTVQVALCNARGVTLLPVGCNNVTGTLACPVGVSGRLTGEHVPVAYPHQLLALLRRL